MYDTIYGGCNPGYWDYSGLGGKLKITEGSDEIKCTKQKYGVVSHVGCGIPYRLANCPHNIVRAIKERLIDKTHDCDSFFKVWGMVAAFSMASYVSTMHAPLLLADPYQLARNAGFGSVKGRKYLKAAQRYVQSGYTLRDSRIKCFIKDETYLYSGEDPEPEVHYDYRQENGLVGQLDEDGNYEETKNWEDRIPRLIQHREPVWFVAASRYMLPLEHWLLPTTMSDFGLEGGPQLRNIGKGLGPKPRANLLWRKWSRFPDPYSFSIDGSKWDRQVCLFLLLMVMIVSVSLFAWSDEFATILMAQMVNTGKFRYGTLQVIYKLFGCRISGDIDTGYGNCFAFLIIIIVCFYDFVGARWVIDFECAIDGDDCVFICNRADLEYLKGRIINVFYSAGHNVTIEGETDIFQKLIWCQAKPIRVYYSDGSFEWTMLRSPAAIISKSACKTEYALSSKKAVNTLYMIAIGEAIINRGVPMIQTWALEIADKCEKLGAKPFKGMDANSSTYRTLRQLLLDNGLVREANALQMGIKSAVDSQRIMSKLKEKFAPLPVDERTRFDYALAFGISTTLQVEFERSCAEISLNFELVEKTHVVEAVLASPYPF